VTKPPKTDAEKARARRSMAIGIGCALFVILVYVITLSRMTGHVASTSSF
jgi:hypothetical protein